MNIVKNRNIKVFEVIDSEREGITASELGKKLHVENPDGLSFANFEEFIKINIISGRIIKKNDKLFISDRGRKVIELQKLAK